VLVAVRVAAGVLVDVEIAVQAEKLRIRPEEALDVGVAGQELPALLLERVQVAVADPDRLLDVLGREAAPGPGFPEAGADLEHRRSV
jgi:hypothetical protein